MAIIELISLLQSIGLGTTHLFNKMLRIPPKKKRKEAVAAARRKKQRHSEYQLRLTKLVIQQLSLDDVL